MSGNGLRVAGGVQKKKGSKGPNTGVSGRLGVSPLVWGIPTCAVGGAAVQHPQDGGLQLMGAAHTAPSTRGCICMCSDPTITPYQLVMSPNTPPAPHTS